MGSKGELIWSERRGAIKIHTSRGLLYNPRYTTRLEEYSSQARRHSPLTRKFSLNVTQIIANKDQQIR